MKDQRFFPAVRTCTAQIIVPLALLVASCADNGESGSEAAGPAIQSFRDCDECPLMVVIEPGTFTMGTPESEPKSANKERPQHEVTIGHRLGIGKFEVTMSEWDTCVRSGGCNGYEPGDEGWGRIRKPVINVHREDALAYVAWLNEKTGLEYRLPSEAEWEYAARAGTQTAYSFGDDETQLCDYANTADISIKDLPDVTDGNVWYLECNDRFGKETAPVGSYRANAWGLHDVHGNVWEWIADCWHDNYEGAPADGSAWMDGDCEFGVLRSASMVDAKGGSLRSGHRGRIDAPRRSFNLGFRVARTIGPDESQFDPTGTGAPN